MGDSPGGRSGSGSGRSQRDGRGSRVGRLTHPNAPKAASGRPRTAPPPVACHRGAVCQAAPDARGRASGGGPPNGPRRARGRSPATPTAAGVPASPGARPPTAGCWCGASPCGPRRGPGGATGFSAPAYRGGPAPAATATPSWVGRPLPSSPTSIQRVCRTGGCPRCSPRAAGQEPQHRSQYRFRGPIGAHDLLTEGSRRVRESVVQSRLLLVRPQVWWCRSPGSRLRWPGEHAAQHGQ